MSTRGGVGSKADQSRRLVESTREHLSNGRALPHSFFLHLNLRSFFKKKKKKKSTALTTSKSALLRHDVAFCLGQRGSSSALPALAARLRDAREHPMVRHEAAEAAGAIGCPGAWRLVEEHLSDATREVAETCQLAVQRMAWYEKKQEEEEKKRKRIQSAAGEEEEEKEEKEEEEKEEKKGGENEQQQQQRQREQQGGEEDKVVVKRYLSVDPAPPAPPGTPTEALVSALLDETASTPIFDRYRALFSLRDAGGAAAVAALCRALRAPKGPSSSALLRHEVAYVLGQMQDPAALGALRECLADEGEHGMVRHEAAEALGALGAEAAVPALEKGCLDGDPVVAQSCVVALDVLAHERSGAFEYAAGAS